MSLLPFQPPPVPPLIRQSIKENFAQCVICAADSFLLKNINKFSVYKCTGCHLEFANPMPSLTQLDHFYHGYEDFLARHDVLGENAKRNLQHICQHYDFRQDQSLLDFGCGDNIFVDYLRDCHFSNCHGFDFFRPRKKTAYITQEMAFNQTWDIITLWDVLEHLTDPIATLSQLSSCLSKDGWLFMTTVYIESKIPFRYKPPEHTLYFSKASLTKLAEKTKLTIAEFRDYVAIQDSDVYMDVITRTVPCIYRRQIKFDLPKYVKVPTNLVFVAFKKS